MQIKIKALLIENSEISRDYNYENLIDVFNVLVGLPAISTSQTEITWRQIQGTNVDLKESNANCGYIMHSAGWTQSTETMKENEKGYSPENLSFNKILNLPHNINKLLCFNKDQVQLLANLFLKVVLATDFGSGMS